MAPSLDQTGVPSDELRKAPDPYLKIQDEMHMVFGCQHSALSTHRVHFEELSAVKARGNTPAGLHLFMNHRNVIPVAKFVQQLQNLMDSLAGAPAENPPPSDTTTFSCLEFPPLFFFWLKLL